MNHKKSLILMLLVLQFMVAIMLTGCRGKEGCALETIDFYKLIEEENLSLTIYYMNPFTMTFMPLDVEGLIHSVSEATDSEQKYQIVVDSKSLKEHIDLLNQINSVSLAQVELEEDHMNARIYYLFENGDGEKLLDVAMWAYDRNIYVNGVLVEEENVFYDIIIPFLPEEEVEWFETYLFRGNESERMMNILRGNPE